MERIVRVNVKRLQQKMSPGEARKRLQAKLVNVQEVIAEIHITSIVLCHYSAIAFAIVRTPLNSER